VLSWRLRGRGVLDTRLDVCTWYNSEGMNCLALDLVVLKLKKLTQ
jgi:hypothetical protein